MQRSPDFVIPDFDAPLDLEARLAAVHPRACVKGMFIQAVVDDAKKVSGTAPGRGRYVAFKDYPFREWVSVLAESAELIYPRLPPREGIRRLGQKAYPTFLSSTVGSVLMAVAGRDFAAALRLVPRIYSISGSGRAEILTLRQGHAEIRLREVWDYPDAFQIGVFEGGLRVFRKTGEVRVRLRSMCDADIEITWVD